MSSVQSFFIYSFLHKSFETMTYLVLLQILFFLKNINTGSEKQGLGKPYIDQMYQD